MTPSWADDFGSIVELDAPPAKARRERLRTLRSSLPAGVAAATVIVLINVVAVVVILSLGSLEGVRDVVAGWLSAAF